MIEFAWWWALVALPLPLLIALFVPRAEQAPSAALRIPFLSSLGNAAGDFSPGRSNIRLFIAAVAWIALIAAAIRPQWVDQPINLPQSGRDLMLAVDISGSMQEQDMLLGKQTLTRLEGVKAVGGEFIERRRGDRIGLILFGTQAYVQTPLTFDRKTVNALLLESTIGLAGEKTAIGDAIGLAVKRLSADGENRDAAKDRILILLTDGANTAGEVQPLQAAELAAEYGLRIHTIGLGADEMMVRSFFGNRMVNPSRDLDETTLNAIAEKTGGRYFRARDLKGLQQIYQLLDEIEPVAKDDKQFRPVKELYPWPLALALILTAGLALSRINLRGAIRL